MACETSIFNDLHGLKSSQNNLWTPNSLYGVSGPLASGSHRMPGILNRSIKMETGRNFITGTGSIQGISDCLKIAQCSGKVWASWWGWGLFFVGILTGDLRAIVTMGRVVYIHMDMHYRLDPSRAHAWRSNSRDLKSQLNATKYYAYSELLNFTENQSQGNLFWFITMNFGWHRTWPLAD